MKSRVVVGACHAVIVSALLATGAAAAAAAGDAPRLIAIEPQSLTTALQSFSRQSGLQLGFESRITAGLQTRGTQGARTPVEALDALLSGTNLEYRFVNDTTIVIRRRIPAERGSALEPDETIAQTLEEVVVTAQKREERLLDVPIAISAFTDTALQDAGAANLADFLESAPGVGIVDNESGTQFIQIRGVNSTFGNAPVGYYLDELPFSYIGNTQVPDVRTYDLERVEILRGPQGTLYGDGSIGGTIRILTKEPELSDLRTAVDLIASDTSGGALSYAAKGMLNVPIMKDVLGLRLVGSREQFGGWVDDTVTGVEDQNDRDIDNYRGKLRWAASDRLDLVLSAWHTKEQAHGSAASFADSTTDQSPQQVATEYDLYSATVRYELDAFDLVSATSLMDYRNDLDTQFLAAPLIIDEDQHLWSEELRLTSKSAGAFRWTAGLFYREIERKTFVSFDAFDLHQHQLQQSDSYAVFGEGTWSFLDRRLDFTLGLRHFEDQRVFREDIEPATLALIQSVDPSFTGEIEPTFHSVNPRFNLAFHPDEHWLLYANIARGFRTGQAQPVASLAVAILQGISIPTSVDPETLWSYELGTKARLANGRVTLESAIFYNDWRDLQTRVVLDPASGLSGLANAGSARTRGIELGVALLPVQGLTLRFAGSYIDARYTQTILGLVEDGDRVVGVPDTILSASATYRWPLTATMTGFMRGSTQYASERTDVVSNALPSDATLDVDLRLGIEGGAWSAYLFGSNLTDETGAIDVAFVDVSGQPLPAARLRPRTFGLNLRFDFR